MRQDINGEKFYVYSKNIDISGLIDQNNHKGRLKFIDEIVKQFARTGKFRDMFYFWSRFEPNYINLVSRNERELDKGEIKMLEKKYELFSKTVRMGLSKLSK